VTVTAATSEEAAAKVGVKGTVGVDYKILKVGGEVSGEVAAKVGSARSFTWKISLPTSTLQVTEL
jgi:hypothetical protein